MSKLIAGLLLLAAGCRKATPSEVVAAEPVSAVNPGQLSPEELNRLLLAGAHILVTHSASLTYPCDVPLPPVISSRSKNDALFQAEMLLQALKEGKKSFAELAQTASDDVFSPVRRFFYHLILRLPLPPEERVSGRSLVIGYAGSPEDPRDDPGAPLPTRSRAQAKALAEKIAKEAHQAPDRFAALVRRHSDGTEARRWRLLGVLVSPARWKECMLNLASVSLKVNQP
ncbi:MAG: peptidylprolyl isomerase [Archangiaceae bacterium]|nr:peptidylprolyl isomerase [Archangiaceae bacterium]